MSHRVAGNVVNLYAEPRASSHMISQAISGAIVETLEETDGFCRIATEDRYEGWLAKEHLVPPWDATDHFQTSVSTLFADVHQSPDPHSELLTKFVVSTRIVVAHRPEIDNWVPLVLPDERIGYVHQVCLNVSHAASDAGADMLDQKTRLALNVHDLKRQVLEAVGAQAAQVGRRFVGTPYLWGGCTPFGLDCSGFVQLCYKLSGLQLLRDAQLQFADRRFTPAEAGWGMENALFQPGDLLAFSNREDGRITHIGLALGDGRFIHAKGGQGVRIDECLTEQYERTYRGAVRISPDADLGIEAA